MLLRKLKTIWRICCGQIIKLYWNITGTNQIDSLPKSDKEPQLIVSLTSYGNRVRETVFYTLISLFVQKKRPNKIILWLDSDSWSLDSIPSKILKLQNKGLEIRFCDENMKSYTKLVPTMREYKDSIIVTADDDIFYSSKMLSSLWNAHIQHPKSVICNIARLPTYDNGRLTPYLFWKTTMQTDSNKVFALGYGGVLYPPNSLNEDYHNIELFKNLCPMADDVWFWIMEIINFTERRVSNSKEIVLYPVNLSEFTSGRGGALALTNISMGGNDKQIEKSLMHYGINTPNKLLSISTAEENL